MATAEEIANKFPAFAHLVAIPEIKELLDKATGTGAGGEWTQDRFQLELQKTNWFRSTSETARKNDALALSDPQTYELNLQDYVRRITQIQWQEGIGSNPETVRAFATMFMREGWDDARMTSWMAANAHTFDQGGIVGQIQNTQQQIKKLASDYGLPVAETWAREKAQQVRAGYMTTEGLKATFTNQAKATYAHLADQLDQGFTVRDIAEPYLQSAAQLLELSPSAMNLSDPRWSRALNERNKDGTSQLMSMGDWQKTLMQEESYGWDRTNNAKTAAYDLRDKLADTFGVR
jgi:hypothetical protein